MLTSTPSSKITRRFSLLLLLLGSLQLDERKDYDKLLSIKAALTTVYGHKVIDNLVTKQRKFVREGALKKVCRGGRVKNYHVWLLSDYLIYASPLGGGKYTLNHCLELAHLRCVVSFSFFLPPLNLRCCCSGFSYFMIFFFLLLPNVLYLV